MPDLLQDFACAQTALQRKRFIRKLGNVDLLIIDEWLGNKLSEEEVNLLFEIFEKKMGNIPPYSFPSMIRGTGTSDSESRLNAKAFSTGFFQTKFWSIAAIST